MKKTVLYIFAAAILAACNQPKTNSSSKTDNPELAKVFDNYFEESLKLYPLNATGIGDNRYNDQLPNDGSVEFLAKSKAFYENYLAQVKHFNREDLSEADQLSYDIFTYEAQLALDGFKQHFEYMPFNQFYALPLTMGQLGSGSGSQPFKTVKDYNDWLKRVSAFSVWADTAISNFNKGIKAGVVLPKALVVKTIPELQDLVVADPAKSLFYGPITNLPKDFSDTDKKQLTEAYKKAITTVISPTYKKLADYLKTEYLPHARTTSGYSALPDGGAKYAYLVKQQTTTDKTPEEIYQTGLKEVSRIRGIMDSIKTSFGVL